MISSVWVNKLCITKLLRPLHLQKNKQKKRKSFVLCMHLDALEHLGTRQDIKQIMIIVGMIRMYFKSCFLSNIYFDFLLTHQGQKQSNFKYVR